MLRKCASVCSERRLQRSWSLSTHSIFFRSHLAEILETQRMRSWRLKESCGFLKVFLWCQVAKNCFSQPLRPACQRSILPRKPVEPSGFKIHQVRLQLEWRKKTKLSASLTARLKGFENVLRSAMKGASREAGASLLTASSFEVI